MERMRLVRDDLDRRVHALAADLLGPTRLVGFNRPAAAPPIGPARTLRAHLDGAAGQVRRTRRPHLGRAGVMDADEQDGRLVVGLVHEVPFRTGWCLSGSQLRTVDSRWVRAAASTTASSPPAKHDRGSREENA